MTTTDNTFHCPRCGNSLTLDGTPFQRLRNKNEQLREVNDKLRKKVRMLKDELEHHGPGHYLASEEADHFHRPGCKWADKIAPSNLTIFVTHEEAVAADYKPCKTCRS